MAKSEKNLNAVFTDTADAIRAKKRTSEKISPRDFADEVASIETGITPEGSLDITENGNNIDVTTKATVNVNVPNPSTGTKNITSNGIHDVKNYANANVNVPDENIIMFDSSVNSLSVNGTSYTVAHQITPSTGQDYFLIYSGCFASNLSSSFNSQNVRSILANNEWTYDDNELYIVPEMLVQYPYSVHGDLNLAFTNVPWADDSELVDAFISQFKSHFTCTVMDFAGHKFTPTTLNINITGEAS